MGFSLFLWAIIRISVSMMTQEEFFKRYTYSPSRDRIGGGGFGTVLRCCAKAPKATNHTIERSVSLISKIGFSLLFCVQKYEKRMKVSQKKRIFAPIITKTMVFMKRAILFSLFSVLMLTVHAQSSEEPFWLGADISGTTGMEARGIQLTNAQGEPRENTALMKELGLNAVRLRVWVNPQFHFSSKEDVLVMAQRAKAQEMAVMIDFHYSDWWADPGKQNIPAAWAEMNYEEMCQALATHTRETLQLLKDHDIDVRWVQVGNAGSVGAPSNLCASQPYS